VFAVPIQIEPYATSTEPRCVGEPQVGREAVDNLCEVGGPGLHGKEKGSPVGYFAMECIGEVGSAFICFGEGHLHVVEMSNCAWDGEVHGPKFPDKPFQFFSGHSTTLSGYGEESGEVLQAGGGQLEGAIFGIDEPAEDLFDLGPVTISP